MNAPGFDGITGVNQPAFGGVGINGPNYGVGFAGVS